MTKPSFPSPRIAIDCDPFAESLKTVILDHVKSLGHEIVDLAYGATRRVDYPDIAINLASQIRRGRFDRGILLCGTGLGVAMCANKVPGIYAGTCHDVYSAERLRKSNDAQIITLGERVIGPELAKMVVEAWLRSDFAGGGSASKVQRMRQLERRLRRNLTPLPGGRKPRKAPGTARS